MNRLIRLFTNEPKKLFLIDALGALLTASLLFIIVQGFSAYFGLPKALLTSLSLAAVLIFCYSALCYFIIHSAWKQFLVSIAAINSLYCIITISLLIYYRSQLAGWSIAYFVAEVSIICGLIWIEWKTAKSINK